MATATMTNSETPNLTANDAAVLSALFNPESSSSSSISITKTASGHPHIPDSTLPDLQAQELSAIQSIDSETPSQCSIETAISSLSNLITEHPQYAPAYLNRAQATRLLIGTATDSEAALFLPQTHHQTSSILTDLTTAIYLATPSSPAAPLSDLQASLLSKAHTHRGYLLLKASQAVINQADSGSALPAELAGRTSEQLEELASQDFFTGGRYGNEIARELSVRTNPYAKMCGVIVREAMRREREEYDEACLEV
jgi:hypothetical protein